MKTFAWLSLMLTVTMHAAEPRYQLRSLIQNDGTLLHIRLDTQTGKTWRLERVLKNRLSITLKGKPVARELERTQINIGALDGFTLQEAVLVLNKAIENSGNERLPNVAFAIPAREPVVDPKKPEANSSRLPKPKGSIPTPGYPLVPDFPGGLSHLPEQFQDLRDAS